MRVLNRTLLFGGDDAVAHRSDEATGVGSVTGCEAFRAAVITSSSAVGPSDQTICDGAQTRIRSVGIGLPSSGGGLGVGFPSSRGRSWLLVTVTRHSVRLLGWFVSELDVRSQVDIAHAAVDRGTHRGGLED